MNEETPSKALGHARERHPAVEAALEAALDLAEAREERMERIGKLTKPTKKFRVQWTPRRAKAEEDASPWRERAASLTSLSKEDVLARRRRRRKGRG